MRARAGDPPRTMPQKILGGRCSDPQLRGEVVDIKVDQVILSRAPMRAFAEAVALGLKKTQVELAIAYDGSCVTSAVSSADRASRAPHSVPPELVQAGIYMARPGIGFPSPVHLERFAAPARFAVTDDPRLASVGGSGMLTLVVSPGQLGQALALGTVSVRPPRSIQILLSGKLRPFVSARDVALELLRRGIDELIRRIEAEHHAPVVLELGGPSARLLSVPERAILCAIAPQLGAAAALFISDDKTESFLRDQRRSKAHRSLAPDAGAPCEEVVAIDLAAVDPLVADEDGQIRPVRDLADKPVHQVVLGGDGGTTLREMLTAATLLKSKRVPARLDLLLAPPSRQMLEVLAQSGALGDLIATGARLVEPDRGLLFGELYPPAPNELSMRTMDPEPRTRESSSFVVASAETIAYAVATGAVGDPRAFKRPVRVTVPRVLPTDDVLVIRDKKALDPATFKSAPLTNPAVGASWKGAASFTFDLIEGLPPRDAPQTAGMALVLGSLDEVRKAAQACADLQNVRAVIARFIPSSLVPLFAGAGVAALGADDEALRSLRGHRHIALPSLSALDGSATLTATLGQSQIALAWLAVGAERQWTTNGTSRPSSIASRRGGHLS